MRVRFFTLSRNPISFPRRFIVKHNVFSTKSSSHSHLIKIIVLNWIHMSFWDWCVKMGQAYEYYHIIFCHFHFNFHLNIRSFNGLSFRFSIFWYSVDCRWSCLMFHVIFVSHITIRSLILFQLCICIGRFSTCHLTSGSVI